MESVTIDDQIYRIWYSGPDNALERFTITSVDPIIGNWSVYKETSEGIIPEAYADDGSIKIKYRAHKIAVDTGASQNIPSPIQETVEFGGIIPQESGITIHDVKVAISDEEIHDLLSLMVHLSESNIVSASETHNKTLYNYPLKVSGIVEKPLVEKNPHLQLLSSIQELMKSGRGDSGRLQFIYESIQNGKKLYTSDKNYLNEKLNDVS